MKSPRGGLRMMVLGAVLAFCLVPCAALAQTPGTGAFATLPPGEQKIALALFEAQRNGTGSNVSKPLTLDQIAAIKQGHRGWGEVFQQMKAQGLLTEKNLGQAVSRYERRHPPVRSASTGRSDAGSDKGVAGGTGRSAEHGDGGVFSATGRSAGFAGGPTGGGMSRDTGVGHGGVGRR